MTGLIKDLLVNNVWALKRKEHPITYKLQTVLQLLSLRSCKTGAFTSGHSGLVDGPGQRGPHPVSSRAFDETHGFRNRTTHFRSELRPSQPREVVGRRSIFFSFSLTVEISWSVFDDSCQFLTDGIKTLHSLVAMNELKPKIHLLLDSSFSKKNIGALSFKAKSKNLPRFFQSIFECCKVARVSCHFHKERQTWKQRGREWINKNRTRWLCKRQNSGWPQRPLL